VYSITEKMCCRQIDVVPTQAIMVVLRTPNSWPFTQLNEELTACILIDLLSEEEGKLH